MYKIFNIAVIFCLMLFVLGCVHQNDISNVNEFKSSKHEKIYTMLKEERKIFNETYGSEFDISRYTKNAKIMTHYNNEDIIVSPQKLKEIWPEKVDNYKQMQIKIRTIEVEDINIEKNTAYVQLKNTYYFGRWNKFIKFRENRVYKNINGEWKFHKSKYK